MSFAITRKYHDWLAVYQQLENSSIDFDVHQKIFKKSTQDHQFVKSYRAQSPIDPVLKYRILNLMKKALNLSLCSIAEAIPSATSSAFFNLEMETTKKKREIESYLEACHPSVAHEIWTTEYELERIESLPQGTTLEKALCSKEGYFYHAEEEAIWRLRKVGLIALDDWRDFLCQFPNELLRMALYEYFMEQHAFEPKERTVGAELKRLAKIPFEVKKEKGSTVKYFYGAYGLLQQDPFVFAHALTYFKCDTLYAYERFLNETQNDYYAHFFEGFAVEKIEKQTFKNEKVIYFLRRYFAEKTIKFLSSSASEMATLIKESNLAYKLLYELMFNIVIPRHLKCSKLSGIVYGYHYLINKKFDFSKEQLAKELIYRKGTTINAMLAYISAIDESPILSTDFFNIIGILNSFNMIYQFTPSQLLAPFISSRYTTFQHIFGHELTEEYINIKFNTSGLFNLKDMRELFKHSPKQEFTKLIINFFIVNSHVDRTVEMQKKITKRHLSVDSLQMPEILFGENGILNRGTFIDQEACDLLHRIPANFLLSTKEDFLELLRQAKPRRLVKDVVVEQVRKHAISLSSLTGFDFLRVIAPMGAKESSWSLFFEAKGLFIDEIDEGTWPNIKDIGLGYIGELKNILYRYLTRAPDKFETTRAVEIFFDEMNSRQVHLNSIREIDEDNLKTLFEDDTTSEEEWLAKANLFYKVRPTIFIRELEKAQISALRYHLIQKHFPYAAYHIYFQQKELGQAAEFDQQIYLDPTFIYLMPISEMMRFCRALNAEALANPTKKSLLNRLTILAAVPSIWPALFKNLSYETFDYVFSHQQLLNTLWSRINQKQKQHVYGFLYKLTKKPESKSEKKGQQSLIENFCYMFSARNLVPLLFINPQDAHLGMEAYDKGLHNGIPEKGYSDSMYAAYMWLAMHLDNISPEEEYEMYLQAHRICMGHTRIGSRVRNKGQRLNFVINKPSNNTALSLEINSLATLREGSTSLKIAFKNDYDIPTRVIEAFRESADRESASVNFYHTANLYNCLQYIQPFTVHSARVNKLISYYKIAKQKLSMSYFNDNENFRLTTYEWLDHFRKGQSAFSELRQKALGLRDEA